MKKISNPKTKQAIVESSEYARNAHVDETVRLKRARARIAEASAVVPASPIQPGLNKRPRKRSVSPQERAWATAYLKHVASVRRLGDISLTDAMPLLQKLYDVAVPDAPSRAPRSTAAIHLAKEIQRITGIELPRQI